VGRAYRKTFEPLVIEQKNLDLKVPLLDSILQSNDQHFRRGLEIIASNREYIENTIPHIGALLRDSLEDALKDAEIVILATRALPHDLQTLLRAGRQSLTSSISRNLEDRLQMATMKGSAGDIDTFTERSRQGLFLSRLFRRPANLSGWLAIEEDPLPDLEINEAPNTVAVISRAVALFRKDSLYSLPPKEAAVDAPFREQHPLQSIQLRPSDPMLPGRGKSHLLAIDDRTRKEVFHAFF
jgi:hypothetical protein